MNSKKYSFIIMYFKNYPTQKNLIKIFKMAYTLNLNLIIFSLLSTKKKSFLQQLSKIPTLIPNM